MSDNELNDDSNASFYHDDIYQPTCNNEWLHVEHKFLLINVRVILNLTAI